MKYIKTSLRVVVIINYNPSYNFILGDKMSIKEIKNRLSFIERELNMSLLEQIERCLEEAEADWYDDIPGYNSLEEIQIEYITSLIENRKKTQMELIQESFKLEKILNEAQSLQHILNMLEEVEIIETTQSVVRRNIREKNIKIEKHYRVEKNNYDIFDWLANADPENFLGFQ